MDEEGGSAAISRQLQQMGFNVADIQRAVQAGGSSLQGALDWILAFGATTDAHPQQQQPPQQQRPQQQRPQQRPQQQPPQQQRSAQQRE